MVACIMQTGILLTLWPGKCIYTKKRKLCMKKNELEQMISSDGVERRKGLNAGPKSVPSLFV
jgi:hypothetical protein